MPDTAVAHRFIPPHWPIATGNPGLVDQFRSITNTLRGWSKGVYEGQVFCAGVPGSPVMVGDADVAAAILFEHPDDFPHGEQFNRLFRPVWGRGIFVAEGADWKWQRRAAAPGLHGGRMKQFAPMMSAAAERTLADWRDDGGYVDIHAAARQLTLRVLLDAVLSGGEDFPSIAEASHHIDRLITQVGRFGVMDVLPIPEWMRPPTEQRGGASNVWLRRHAARMVARRRNAPPRGDMVDLLFAAVDPETGQRMDDELVRDNLVGFIAAGHETSSYALSWALWLVAHHPQTERRLVEEVTRVAGDSQLTAEHLDDLVFTRQVLQETMRLYPGAVAIARSAARDIEIKGHRFRRGQLCLLATHAFHRRPDFWPDPDAFDPDRFAPGRQTTGRPRLAYMPFGGGPRVCMGAAFAMTELTLALASLVRAVRFEDDPQRPLRLGVRMNAFVGEGGMWMRPVAR